MTIIAGDWKALSRQIDLAKEKLHLPEDCLVISCYEAGRDGFWIHRMLEKFGITNLIFRDFCTKCKISWHREVPPKSNVISI
uniref:Uncharacterized protein n=1 Tax=Candidatus Kentrum sp. SD TaxID=2126332 RepID=A0A450YUC6_9GAMM|nr:MAG: hypothetical protein BECKSD772F_GA0070984_10511 [Candidatus Kentron sp. SD]VFK45170.1 MAG: hypothetical protein BECKSD772E_GA0070983_104919 [Candidatus Kentron sp. SD]